MTPFTFDVSISSAPPAGSSVVVGFVTIDGTASTEANDYEFNSGILTFASNTPTLQQITINVIGDTIFEPNETFTVRLSDLSGGNIVIVKPNGIGTIFNDDVAGTPLPTPTPGLRVEGDVVDANGGPNGDNAVRANDVTVIRELVLGIRQPLASGAQFQAADVNLVDNNGCGNGAIDAGDVTVVRQYVLGMLPTKPACGPTGPVTTGPNDGLERVWPDSTIRLENTQGEPRGQITVPVEIDATGTESTMSFTLNWNPAVLTFVAAEIPQESPDGANLGTNLAETDEGRLGVLIDSIGTFASGTRRVMLVTFEVAKNAEAGKYAVTFSEGPTKLSLTTIDGKAIKTAFETGTVTIQESHGSSDQTISGRLQNAPDLSSAAGVTVSGRVLTEDGRGLRNATVTLADSHGNRRTAATRSLGVYRFDDIGADETYVITISSKLYRFAPRVVLLHRNLADLDFIGLD